jgi:hypothetical protein
MKLYSLTGWPRLEEKWPLLVSIGVAPALVLHTLDRDALPEQRRAIARIAAAFGTPAIVHLPFRDEPSGADLAGLVPELADAGARLLLAHAFAEDLLAPAAEAAARLGLGLAIENTFEPAAEPVITLAERLGAGIVLDIPRIRTFSRDAPELWLRRARGRLTGLHAYGSDGEDRHLSLTIGDRGWIDEALAAAGDDAAMLIDVPREGLAASAEVMRRTPARA